MIRISSVVCVLTTIACGEAPLLDAPSLNASYALQPCTNALGNSLDRRFGRLDGVLVTIVNPHHRGCSGDADHLHLQIRVNGAVYDVAVNVHDPESENGVFFRTAEHPLVGEPYSEGWHATHQHLDFINDLHLHADDFAPLNEQDLVERLHTELDSKNQIAIYATGYGPQGVHLIHRTGGAHDGAIAVDPLSTQPRYLLFHFERQHF